MKKIIALILALSLVTALSACSGTSTQYTVGIVEYSQHSAQGLVVQGFKDALTDKLGDKVTFNVQNAANDASIAGTIVNTFVSDNVDLIMADNTQSLQIAANTTFDIPVLGAAITDYYSALGVSPDGINVSGTSDLAPLDKQADIIPELFPEAKNVGIIYCSSEVNSLYQANKVQEHLSEKGIIAKEYPFADANDLPLILDKMCREVDVVYIPTDNTVASSVETVDLYCRQAKIGVVTGEKGLCSIAGAATLSIDYYALGRKTGEMAYRVLVEGESVNNMPVEFAENVTKLYNSEICEELGISVPEDYIPLE